MADPPVSVLYIAGAGRSGSTLLELLLARRRNMVPVGELRFIWQRGVVEDHLCSCGRPFSACPFWTEVLDRAYGSSADAVAAEMLDLDGRLDRMRRIPQMRIPQLRRNGFGPEFERYGDLLAKLYRAVIDVSGGNAVIDSSKEPPYAFALAASPGIDPFVVHLVRDSRAVAYSWQRTKVRPEISTRVQYMRRFEPSSSAREWLRKNALFEVMAVSHRGGYRRLLYEEFTRDPEGHIADLMRRWSTAGHPDPGEVVNGPREVHSVSGNPIRFDREVSAVRPDMEWRERMDTRTRRTVALLTLPLLVRYGYVPQRRQGAS
ncbi:MAG TPA: hypothetical protein VM785_04510 [Gaiellales bacterium]|nr:hypothetical protein [Gaiellales bacterium]